MDREIPFHEVHSTEIPGLSKVVGDDERFYNNLFIGHGGLSVYNEWTALNLQASGNVYLSGAKPSSHDLEALVIADFDPGISLKEDSDGWLLEMAIDFSRISEEKRNIITTRLLGKEKIPDAPFERPDGTALNLDTDYFGKKRDVNNPAPGPFEHLKSGKNKLKVW